MGEYSPKDPFDIYWEHMEKSTKPKDLNIYIPLSSTEDDTFPTKVKSNQIDSNKPDLGIPSNYKISIELLDSLMKDRRTIAGGVWVGFNPETQQQLGGIQGVYIVASKDQRKPAILYQVTADGRVFGGDNTEMGEKPIGDRAWYFNDAGRHKTPNWVLSFRESKPEDSK